MSPKRDAPGDLDELVAEVRRRTGYDEAEIRRVIEILRAVEEVRSEHSTGAAPRSGFETLREQYERVPDLGQPFPTWGEALLHEIGVADDQHAYARDLLIRVMVTVGPDEQAVRSFLYSRHPLLKMSPAGAIAKRGWRALDALLRLIFADPMS